MYFGFPASSSRSVQLEGDTSLMRQLVSEAFAMAGWRFEVEDERTFVAKIPMGIWSYGERLTVSIHQDGILEARSVCVWPMQIFDWGKNERNIDKFFQNLTTYVRNRPLGLDVLPAAFDEEGSTPVERALRDKSG
jgi:hypothetical protein